MTDIIARLTEYNQDWRTRAGSAKEVNEAIEEIKRLRAELEKPCACRSEDGLFYESKTPQSRANDRLRGTKTHQNKS